MPHFSRTLQTGRNTLQATRINLVSQARGMFGGGFGLQDQEPEGFAGLGLNIWPWPVLSKVQGGAGGGIFGAQPPPPDDTETVGLGLPSRAASIPGQTGVQRTQREGGMHIF